MRRSLTRRSRLTAVLASALVTTGVALAQQAATVGTLDGHTDPVYAVAFSRDGKLVVTGGFDNTVRLWDAVSRKELKKFEGHTNLVLAVAPSPDGKHVLSGSLDKSAKLWAVPTTGPARDLKDHPAAVHGLAVKPDGKLAAVGTGNAVRLWDLGEGKLVRDLAGHAGEVSAAAWRGDGNQLATADSADHPPLEPGRRASQGMIETLPTRSSVLPTSRTPAARLGGLDGLARLWQLLVADPKVIDAKGAITVNAASSRRRSPRHGRRQDRPRLESRRRAGQGDQHRRAGHCSGIQAVTAPSLRSG
ncbi:MAG: WD40 repeat domain-containing protein [Isosphaeraceae bacterium]